jgi:uncharacterized protein
LRYKINNIPSEGKRVTLTLGRDLLADALAGMEADLDATSGSAALELTRTGENVLCTGTLEASVTLPCALCLGPTGVRVEVPLRLLFTPEDEELGDDDAVDELDVGHHDGETLDLAPTLREQLILGVPMTVRCREGCRGLCPVCGQDRNLSDCGHKAPEGESPFAALKHVKLD